MKTILIVEDDDFMAKAYLIKLREAGYNAFRASNVAEAEKYLSENDKPNAIILDLIMPEKSGVSFLSELKSSEEYKDIPVLIASNLGQDEDIKLGMQLGAEDYVTKADTTIKDIMEKIDNLV